MNYHLPFEAVVETLKNAKEGWRQKKCILLVGAGCSLTAGIPLASGFVDIIKERFPYAYKRAREKTYPHCMAELSLGERHDLIAEFVDKAIINPAHVGIARLIKHGYADIILTTNFDPLIYKACAEVNVYPAIYDLAATNYFEPAFISKPAVCYLHGQRTGFVQLNTCEECKKRVRFLKRVFEAFGQDNPWLVIGYSGENDPIFKRLAKTRSFNQNLFWVCREKRMPPKHVIKELLVKKKGAFYVNDFDADEFFNVLTEKLGILE